jgi:hypothetical protein
VRRENCHGNDCNLIALMFGTVFNCDPPLAMMAAGEPFAAGASGRWIEL